MDDHDDDLATVRDEGICAPPKYHLVEAAINLVVALLVCMWTMRRSRQALLADEFNASEQSSRFVLLPIYQYVLYVLVVATTIYTITSMVEGFGGFDNGDWPRAITSGIWHGVNSAFGEGVALLLLQVCVGVSTIRKIAFRTCVWGTLRGLFGGWTTMMDGDSKADSIQNTLDLMRTVFYWSLWILPSSWVYRRPAMKYYARGQAMFQVVHLISFSVVVYITKSKEGAVCEQLAQRYLYALVFPFLIYHTLLTDGNYWRGLLDDDSGSSDHSSKNGKGGDVPINAPLLGISITEQAAASIAEHLDDQYLMVPRLNYAFLSLGQPKPGMTGVGNLLAAGGTARVYAGSYKGQPLAIKLIYCLELTPEIVRNFGREANRLYALGSNIHVVSLVGICVRPPSLAMALELCHYGSLADVLHRHYQPAAVTPVAASPATPVAAEQQPNSRSTSKSAKAGDLHAAVVAASVASANSIAMTKNNRYLLLDRRTRLIIALHVARGVAAMHAQIPALLHLDLKAQNFLVARRTDVVALSRVLPRLARRKVKPAEVAAPPSTATPSSNDDSNGNERKNGVRIITEEEILERTSFVVKIADLELSTHASDIANIRIPDTYQWTAPELLTGSLDERKSRVSTSSDCFALGCVLYEIETGVTPYAQYANARVMDDQVMIGRITGDEQLRPLPSDDNKGIDDALVQLMRQLWSATPSERPSAATVVTRLTQLALACDA